jgi:hypothetical protein
MARPAASAEEPENQQGAGNGTHNPSTQRTGPGSGFARRLTALLNQTENGGLDEDTHEPADGISYEEFTAHWGTDPERCWEAISRIYIALDTKANQNCAEAALLNEQLIESQSETDDLKRQNEQIRQEHEQIQTQLIAANLERDEAREKLEEAIRERNDFALQVARRSGIGNAGSQASAASSKSAKIPDPPLLSDGKDPHFEDWLLAIKQKLIANADHFPNPMMRITYVTSRTEGNARKHITPHLREDAVNPYQDSTDLLKHLENVFADPNRERVAKRKYNTLYMKPSVKWNDFISEFLYLAAEASVPEETWKDDLYNKLSLRMQELTMPAYNDDDKTFREFTDYCSRTATNIENMERIKARLNGSANTRTRGTGATSRATTPAAATPSVNNATARGRTATASPAPSNLDDETRKRLMSEGKCFTCFQVGHTSRSCPMKQAAQLKVLERPVEPTPAPENEDA